LRVILALKFRSRRWRIEIELGEGLNKKIPLPRPMQRKVILMVFLALCATCKAADSGIWSRPELVSTESNTLSYRACIAVDINGTLHVAWKDKTDYKNAGKDFDIFYKKCNGRWSLTEVVSTESTRTSNCLALAVDSYGVVHVAWKDDTDYAGCGADYDIFYKKKAPGSNWTSAEVVSTESDYECSCPALGVDKNGTVHIAWAERRNRSSDIFYKMKAPNGNWTEEEVVSIECDNESTEPFIAIDNNGNVHIAWADKSNIYGSGSDKDIFYKMKPHKGNWTKPEVISTESTGTSCLPFLAIERRIVHVAWTDSSVYAGSGIDKDIFYKKRINGKWTRTEVVSTESWGNCERASLAIDSNGTVHIAWSDQTDYNNAGIDYDIFYKNKPVNGSWTRVEVVSKNDFDSYFPYLVFYNKVGHLTWYEDRGIGEDKNVRYVTLYSKYQIEKPDRVPGFELILFLLAFIIILGKLR
jgi:hypothetical protein